MLAPRRTQSSTATNGAGVAACGDSAFDKPQIAWPSHHNGRHKSQPIDNHAANTGTISGIESHQRGFLIVTFAVSGVISSLHVDRT